MFVIIFNSNNVVIIKPGIITLTVFLWLTVPFHFPNTLIHVTLERDFFRQSIDMECFLFLAINWYSAGGAEKNCSCFECYVFDRLQLYSKFGQTLFARSEKTLSIALPNREFTTSPLIHVIRYVFNLSGRFRYIVNSTLSPNNKNLQSKF